MIIEIQNFIGFIRNVKKVSPNTEVSYQRDLLKMAAFMEDQGVIEPSDVTGDLLSRYEDYLMGDGMANSSISRMNASMKAFFEYLCVHEGLASNPAMVLKTPRIEKKVPELLTQKEVRRLLEQPSGDKPKELRDRAMLEVLYSTGIRVSELISLKIDDVDLKKGILTVDKDGEIRRISLNASAKKALKDYLDRGRVAFLADLSKRELFFNCSGKAMSRQGFWKLIKHYADRAGINKDITPYTLRHSLAVHMIESGADVKEVSHLLGHSDVATTQFYTSLATK